MTFQLGNKICIGRVLSSETRLKMSESAKGKPPVSIETKKRMCLAQTGHPGYTLGRKHSEETKRKIGLTSIGRIPSEETRKKLSIAHMGNKSWTGKKHSMADRIKMSQNCKGKLAKEKNPNWKGGVSKANDLARHSFEYTLWRESVFIRDNWTCQKTGIRGGYLIAHHINNFSDNLESRTSIENGITLSRESHNEFHRIYGKINNTREQLEEFLNNK